MLYSANYIVTQASSLRKRNLHKRARSALFCDCFCPCFLTHINGLFLMPSLPCVTAPASFRASVSASIISSSRRPETAPAYTASAKSGGPSPALRKVARAMRSLRSPLPIWFLRFCDSSAPAPAWPCHTAAPSAPSSPFLVFELRFVLTRHHQPGRYVRDAHRAESVVFALPAVAGRAEYVHTQVVGVDLTSTSSASAAPPPSPRKCGCGRTFRLARAARGARRSHISAASKRPCRRISSAVFHAAQLGDVGAQPLHGKSRSARRSACTCQRSAPNSAASSPPYRASDFQHHVLVVVGVLGKQQELSSSISLLLLLARGPAPPWPSGDIRSSSSTIC